MHRLIRKIALVMILLSALVVTGNAYDSVKLSYQAAFRDHFFIELFEHNMGVSLKAYVVGSKQDDDGKISDYSYRYVNKEVSPKLFDRCRSFFQEPENGKFFAMRESYAGADGSSLRLSYKRGSYTQVFEIANENIGINELLGFAELVDDLVVVTGYEDLIDLNSHEGVRKGKRGHVVNIKEGEKEL